jgi:hypothetical protein
LPFIISKYLVFLHLGNGVKTVENEEQTGQTEQQRIAETAAAAVASELAQIESEKKITELEQLAADLKAAQEWQENINRWKDDEVNTQWQRIQTLETSLTLMSETLEAMKIQLLEITGQLSLLSLPLKAEKEDRTKSDTETLKPVETEMEAAATATVETPPAPKKRNVWI